MGTLKLVGLGVWVAIVALGATYWSATSGSGETVDEVRQEHAPPETTKELRRPAAITVPMIADGQLSGYVVAKVVYTADPATLHAMPFDPQPFIVDEAFRKIYTDGRIEFDHLSKYNLAEMTEGIRTAVNARLGTELVQEVLIEELSYVDRKQLEKAGGGEGGR